MVKHTSKRVLVLGDDMRICLTVVRSLGRAGIRVGVVPFDVTSPVLRSRYINKVHVLPDFASDPASWRAELGRLVEEEAYDLIVPCADPAIIALDSARSIAVRTAVAIPDGSSMDAFFDKEQTHAMCRGLGVETCAAMRLDLIEDPATLAPRFGLPMVIKPRRSYTSNSMKTAGKVEIVYSETELGQVLARIEDPSSYLVEEYFEGSGIGISVLAQDGKIRQAFQHRRLREGKGGCSSYRVSEALNPSMLEACEKVCRHTRHTGVCMFEFRRNSETGQWVLLEINARFWGSMALPVALGLDFPNLLYDLLVRDIASPRRDYRAGVRSRNLVLDGYNIALRPFQTPRVSLGRWSLDLLDFLMMPLRLMSGGEHSDSIVLDDIQPALWEFLALPAQITKKIWLSAKVGKSHDPAGQPKPSLGEQP